MHAGDWRDSGCVMSSQKEYRERADDCLARAAIAASDRERRELRRFAPASELEASLRKLDAFDNKRSRVCSAASETPWLSAPWTAEEHDFCFLVRDSNYQVLAYIYFEDDPLWRVTARLLTRAEARRLASCIAKLPELTHP